MTRVGVLAVLYFLAGLLGREAWFAFGNAGYCFAMLGGIPLAFHFFGLTGAVVAVAAGDFPLYVITQFGATREGLKPLWQDLKFTIVFIAFIALNVFIRKAL